MRLDQFVKDMQTVLETYPEAEIYIGEDDECLYFFMNGNEVVRYRITEEDFEYYAKSAGYPPPEIVNLMKSFVHKAAMETEDHG